MTSIELAAWFQAIGSILGIAAAVMAPLLMDSKRTQSAEKRGKQKARTIAVAVYADVRELERKAFNFYEQTNPEHDQQQPFDYRALDGDFTRIAPRIRAALISIEGSEELAELLRQLTIDVSRAENWMANINDMMRAGHHAAYVNNQNELREIAHRIKEGARTLCDAIEDLFPDQAAQQALSG